MSWVSEQPDFDSFKAVITGKADPQRVHWIELGVDQEVRKIVLNSTRGQVSQAPEDEVSQEVAFYELMGYDCITTATRFLNKPAFQELLSEDYAIQPRDKRRWAQEGIGLINSWDDYHAIEWDRILPEKAFLIPYKNRLPAGMKILIFNTLFEHILEWWMGYEGLFTNLVDNPDLVKKLFDTWGQKVFDSYELCISDPDVGGIFHADDLGFKTSTLISPKSLRALLFPWLKKYAQLAHSHNKIFLFHACGAVEKVMPDLIEDVKIDGFHSFQDQILPVVDFYERYPSIAALGGVDVDKLARLEEKDLRAYVRSILDHCGSHRRFALGSGNTVANYIPAENYLMMIDEARRFWSDTRKKHFNT